MAATDSRWSLSLGHAVLYIDDTSFEKIAHDGKLVFIFAGNSARIRDWKAWIANPQSTVSVRPPVDDIAICIIELASATVVFEHDQHIMVDDGRFAGTGAWPAYTCWNVNRDALKAVESAKLADRFSGGNVKFFNLSTGEKNLNEPDDFDSIKNELLTRGMVMYFQNPAHVPVKEAAANDKVVDVALDQIAKGQQSLTAPCPAAANQWTEDEKSRLDSVLERYYPKG